MTPVSYTTVATVEADIFSPEPRTAAFPTICKACDCPIDSNGCGCNPHDA